MKKYHLYVVMIPDLVWWRVRDGDSPVSPLTEIPPWSVLHPFAYQDVLIGIGDPQRIFVTSFGDDFLVSTDKVVFIAEDSPTTPTAHEVIYAAACLFLRNLRCVSWQAQLRTLPTAVGQTTCNSFPEVARPVRGTLKASTRADICDSAATWKNVLDAAARKRDFEILPHVEIFLDAINASMSLDFRTGMLYAAVSMEVLVKNALYAAYEQQKQRAMMGDKGIWRFVNVAILGGEIWKDPVATLLLERDNFSNLLHETSLYVIGRSLLAEQENTFQRAIQLYRTRNKIAHQGEVPDDGKCLEFNEQGMKQALLTAASVFEWFGETPKGAAISLRQNVRFYEGVMSTLVNTDK